MFEKARIKLTAWYLLIIMIVSISFSAVIYRGVSAELNRIRVRVSQGFPAFLPSGDPHVQRFYFDPDIILETQNRIKLTLLAINLFILGGSAIAGYFLAGRTLKPISDMVDEQNRFISDASHELRTPLTALRAEIEVNLRNKKLTAAEGRRLLQSNLEEVNNLQNLSDNLIKLTGNNNLTLERIKLAVIIKEAIRRISVAAKTKHIHIMWEGSDAVVYGNTTLLTELFIILFDNAIKYSAKGKIVRVAAKKHDGYIGIQIIDQGYGIDKEDLPHLFDRFWRADKSRTKTEVPGYGLGLAIAKQIINRHHGSISVESIVGKGSMFTISLPS